MADGAPTWATFTAKNAWTAGVSSGFLTPPSMAQINAAVGINQIVGYINRKQSQTTGASALSYVSSNSTLAASYMTSIQTAINALRTGIGLSSFSFANTFTSNMVLKDIALTELQTSLSLTKTFTNTTTAFYKYAQSTTYPGDPTGTWTYTATAGGLVGKETAGQKRNRSGTFFDISALTFGTNAVATIGSTIHTPNGSDNIQIYASSSDDSAFNPGYESNLNNSCGTSVYSGSSFSIPVSNTILNTRSGGKISFVIGTDAEFASSGAASISNITLDADVTLIVSW